jgi:hypothetical protein
MYFNRGGVLQETNLILECVVANIVVGGVLQRITCFSNVPQPNLPKLYYLCQDFLELLYHRTGICIGRILAILYIYRYDNK